MRRAAQAATVGFAALAVFQAALAAGAPLGAAAWGGADAHLTTAQRVGSALSVAFFTGAILVVRARARGRQERRFRWGTWTVAVVLGLAALANLASESLWENFLLAPVALVLAALCVVLARHKHFPGFPERANRSRERYSRSQRHEVGEVGFEPTKAEPTGLQPVPFGHSGTPPRRRQV